MVVTSVKEFRIECEPADDDLGRGSFVFTDDYSVFDWGAMPDEIPGKGASLCTMSAFNFERLEAAGVPTHYRGVVDGEVVSLADAEGPPREMAIDLVRVPDLPSDGRDYDYDAYHDAAGGSYLIPLEIVFRNRVPVGSSLRRRDDPADHGLDGGDWPDGPVELDEPIVEFSTKYEESDRYLDPEKADRIAGRADVDDLEAVAREVNALVTERAESAGLTHEDGKIECLYHRGEIRVADAVGTFDENRFSYDGQQVSKEVVRQHHRRSQPEWVAAVEEAKSGAKRRDVADWRALCDAEPAPLSSEVVGVAADLYTAGTNAYTGREWFDAPPFDEAIAATRNLA